MCWVGLWRVYIGVTLWWCTFQTAWVRTTPSLKLIFSPTNHLSILMLIEIYIDSVYLYIFGLQFTHFAFLSNPILTLVSLILFQSVFHACSLLFRVNIYLSVNYFNLTAWTKLCCFNSILYLLLKRKPKSSHLSQHIFKDVSLHKS